MRGGGWQGGSACAHTGVRQSTTTTRRRRAALHQRMCVRRLHAPNKTTRHNRRGSERTQQVVCRSDWDRFKRWINLMFINPSSTKTTSIKIVKKVNQLLLLLAAREAGCRPHACRTPQSTFPFPDSEGRAQGRSSTGVTLSSVGNGAVHLGGMCARAARRIN